MGRTALSSLEARFLAEPDVPAARRLFLRLFPDPEHAHPTARLEHPSATDVPMIERAQSYTSVQDLLGLHELAEVYVERAVQRCLSRDTIDENRWPDVISGVLRALEPVLSDLQRGILTHSKPWMVHHLHRFLPECSLRPGRLAYLDAIGRAPESSVVGYVEHSLHGSPEERSALVDWSAEGPEHSLLLVSGLRIRVDVTVCEHHFSALELLRRDRDAHTEPLDAAAVEVPEPEPPSFYPTRAPASPAVDALVTLLGRPVGVQPHPPQDSEQHGSAPLDVCKTLLREHPAWVRVHPQRLQQVLGSGPTWEVALFEWVLARLQHGLARIVAETRGSELVFGSLAALWLSEGPYPHPRTRRRTGGAGARFAIDPVSSFGDQRLIRLLLSHGRDREALLDWMVANWDEASATVQALVEHAGREAIGVIALLNRLRGDTRSASAQRKRVSMAARQAWCLVELDNWLAGRPPRDRTALAENSRWIPSVPWSSGQRAATFEQLSTKLGSL